MNPITYVPIGLVRSPFTMLAGMPLQPPAAQDVLGTVELASTWHAGLKDLEAFSHVILVTHLHRMVGYRLEVTPYLDDQPHGIFATRSPQRPNPLGLSVVRLLAIEGERLHIAGVDVLDGTPLLDLKPYVPAFDAPAAERIGWFAGRLERLLTTRADDRFG
jgi:tRNA-Thr(GGU) m(6)t(6)A37 methyltransferase TsaA